jgi:uncharacterized protein YdbL (DUF1318 family)
MKRAVPVVLAILMTVACIHVVVNVYFPESAAKGALATLEDELLKGSPPPAETVPPPAQAPKPQGFFRSLVSPETAYAQAAVTEADILNRIKGMPEVVEAYQRIGSRMGRVDAMRVSGTVGEGREGLLVVRGALADRRDQRTVDEENADRQTVIRGLARAAVQAQGMPASEENIAQVMAGSQGTFAALRRERAQAGWWILMPDGNWQQK